jgi:hypothetical protein
MKIDRKLNIVLTIVESVEVTEAVVKDGKPVIKDGQPETKTVSKDVPVAYVHAEPISTEIYEAHFLVLTKTLLGMYDQGIQVADSASRIAMLMLRQTAAQMGPGVTASIESGLFPEIWRLTNVLMPGKGGNGWQLIPFQEVIQNKLLGEEDIKEVQNRLCFFTAASHFHSRAELAKTVWPMLEFYGAQITSSTSTEYLTSLPISTTTANTGAKATPSSIPL